MSETLPECPEISAAITHFETSLTVLFGVGSGKYTSSQKIPGRITQPVAISQAYFDKLMTEALSLAGGERVSVEIPSAILPTGAIGGKMRWLPKSMFDDGFSISIQFPK